MISPRALIQAANKILKSQLVMIQLTNKIQEEIRLSLIKVAKKLREISPQALIQVANKIIKSLLVLI